MSHTQILLLRLTVSLMAGVSLFLLAFPAQAQFFQLDFDSIQTDFTQLQAADRILEGGLTSQQIYGEERGLQVFPLGAPAYCGDGVKESGEACDGTDLGDATCQSSGFSAGALRCTASCTVDTAGCSNTSAGSAATGQRTTGGGRGAGGGRKVPVKYAQGSPNITESTPPSPGVRSSVTSGRNPQVVAPVTVGTGQHPAEAFHPAAPENLADVPSAGSESSASQNATGTVSVGRIIPKVVDTPVSENASPVASAANAIVLGSMSLTQAGILARLGWIARLKSLYSVIPAFS